MIDIGVSKEKSRNMSLDVLKLIASYVVVFIHFKFSGLTGDIVDALSVLQFLCFLWYQDTLHIVTALKRLYQK